MISENLQGASSARMHQGASFCIRNYIDVVERRKKTSCVVSTDFPHEVIPQLPDIVLVHFSRNLSALFFIIFSQLTHQNSAKH